MPCEKCSERAAKREGKVFGQMDFPLLYNRKAACCGCTACCAICPESAISMVEDEEGFDYPQLDAQKCVRCYLCLKVCPIER